MGRKGPTGNVSRPTRRHRTPRLPGFQRKRCTSDGTRRRRAVRMESWTPLYHRLSAFLQSERVSEGTTRQAFRRSPAGRRFLRCSTCDPPGPRPSLASRQRAVDAREVVAHVVQRNGCRVVLQLLTESVRQSREPANRHPHRGVLALDVALKRGHYRSLKSVA